MARINPVKNKEGKIISYQIRVFRGKDTDGRELRPYSYNWKIPDTYKTESAIKRGLEKAVREFEYKCKSGDVSADKRTFQEYAEYFLVFKQRDCKQSGIRFYQSLLPRINAEIGAIRIGNLTVEHLNRFYLKLESADIREDQKAIAKDALIEAKEKYGYSNVTIQKLTNLSENTIRVAFQRKRISILSAQKITSIFDGKVTDYFEIASLKQGKGLSAKSIRHYHDFIHDVLKLAVKEGIVSRNIADMAEPPKLKRHEAEYFEIDEIIQIRKALDVAPLKYKVMVCLLVETGCRRGELFGLKWKSINFKDKTIVIDSNIQYSKEKGIYEDSPKNGEVRTVSIAPEVMQLLDEYQVEQMKTQLMLGIPDYNSKGYLFIQDDGTPMHPSSLNHWMRKFEKENELPHIYPHKFRHSQASILYASGVDLVTISKRLGHKQVSTTQNIYAHLMKESDRKASEAIANALYRKEV